MYLQNYVKYKSKKTPKNEFQVCKNRLSDELLCMYGCVNENGGWVDALE